MSTGPGPRQRRRIAGERHGGRTVGAAERDHDVRPDGAPQPGATAATAAPAGGEASASRAAGRDHEDPERARRPLPGWGLAVLGALAVGLVVIAVVGVAGGMGIHGYQELRDEQEVEQARRTAPAAAERAAAAILAYDYRSLKADRNAAAQFMTEDYRAQYRKTFGNLVPESARKLKAVVTADVKASGVVHADPERANVLLFVNQRTVSTAHEEPQLALNRVVLAMEERDGTWLVDDITAY